MDEMSVVLRQLGWPQELIDSVVNTEDYSDYSVPRITSDYVFVGIEKDLTNIVIDIDTPTIVNSLIIHTSPQG